MIEARALLLAAALAATATPAAAYGAPRGAPDKAAIVGIVTSYFAALNASDTKTIVSLYTADGVFLQPSRGSWIGREAIARAYDTLFKVAKVDTEPQLAEVIVASPDWAIARATAGGSITSRANGAKQDGPTQELFVLRKVAGAWKIARFAFSPVASRAQPATP